MSFRTTCGKAALRDPESSIKSSPQATYKKASLDSLPSACGLAGNDTPSPAPLLAVLTGLTNREKKDEG
jgi:hypothetical protein